MKDTPEHINKLQLQIWFSKSPEQRLKQAIEDNAAMFRFWKMNQNQSRVPGTSAQKK
jgi:hypothetical protein